MLTKASDSVNNVDSLSETTTRGEKRTLRNIDPLTRDNLISSKKIHKAFEASRKTRGEKDNVIGIRNMQHRKTTSRKSIRINNEISDKTIKATGKDISNEDKEDKEYGAPLF